MMTSYMFKTYSSISHVMLRPPSKVWNLCLASGPAPQQMGVELHPALVQRSQSCPMPLGMKVEVAASMNL